MSRMDFNERPILVFWETTRACLLACSHCRAEAMAEPLPGELATDEAFRFVDSLLEFGEPYPVLIMTGGDVLMRQDVFTLVQYARNRGIPVGMAPSVTPRLSDENIQEMKRLGVKAVSISLDGASAAVHEGIRGIPGHFEDTLKALRRLVGEGFAVQVNTAVMQDNVEELPAIAQILRDVGVDIWEVFFLIHVGRGKESHELSPSDCEAVCHFLYDASCYGLTVRTVEAPFFRPIVMARHNAAATATTVGPATTASDTPTSTIPSYALYQTLQRDLRNRLGDPVGVPKAQTARTRDGKGIIFVAYDGTVYPAGFLPAEVGNVREQPLPLIYRESPLLQSIREGKFSGRCGDCVHRDLCGGSRSRAFARYADPLAEDPSCPFAAVAP